MLVWLNTLPEFVAVGLFSAAMAAAGAWIGLVLARFDIPFARYVFVAFAAAAVPVGDRFVVPKLLELEINQNLPVQGENSTLVSVEISRDQHILHFELHDPGDEAARADVFKRLDMYLDNQFAQLCQQWSEQLGNGEVTTIEYQYRLKERTRSLVVDQKTCSADSSA